jgi:hypothetical protein
MRDHVGRASRLRRMPRSTTRRNDEVASRGVYTGLPAIGGALGAFGYVERSDEHDVGRLQLPQVA